jgi:hypothetical protein
MQWHFGLLGRNRMIAKDEAEILLIDFRLDRHD